MEIGSKRIPVDDSRVVTFRRATSEDDSFLLAVYASTRMEELALTNWDDAQRRAFVKMQFEAQISHYREHYPEAEQLIILVNGAATGRLHVANITGEIRILDITLLLENRNAGIGTMIVRELIAEAALIGKPLRIYVESFNPSLRLFDSLGFVKVDEHGYSYLMAWRAA